MKTAILLFVAVVVALFVISFDYVSAAAFNGVDFNTINADTAFNLTSNVTAWGTDLTGGELVCAGTINITATASGLYENLSNKIVPCPTYGCGPRPAGIATLEPFPLFIVSAANYNGNVAAYYNSPFYLTAQAPNPLAPYVGIGQYYHIDSNPDTGAKVYVPVGAPAAFSHGMFCYGSFDLFVNGVAQTSVPLNATMGITNYVLSSGGALVYANATVSNCSFFIRTSETDGPTKDSAYPTLYFPRMIGSSLNFTVTNGPNISAIMPLGSYLVAPSSPVTLIIPIQNTGEMNATFVNITMTDGFNVTGFSPSGIMAGQALNLTINTISPATISALSPNITITYTSNTTAIGTCGNGTQTNVSIGTIIIGDTIPPVTIATANNSDGSNYGFGPATTFLPPPVNVTLRCTDVGFGCNTTFYCMASGVCTPTTVYNQSYSFTNYGSFKTCFYSNDLAGNTEVTQCRDIIIEEPTSLSVHVTATPSGILKDTDGSLHPAQNVNINASVRRDDFSRKIYIPPQSKNISIYRVSPTNSGEPRILVKRYEENDPQVHWANVYEGGNLTLVYTVNPLSIDVSSSSVYPAAVYQVAVTMYDPLLRQAATPASTYFVIYELGCADKG